MSHQKNKPLLIKIKLVAYQGSEVSKEIIFETNRVLVGSSEQAQFRIDCESVSANHAFVVINDEESGTLIDLESTTGVFINGKKVQHESFYIGDVIRIGDFDFYVEETGEKVEVRDEEQEIKEKVKAQAFVAPQVPRPSEQTKGLTLIDDEYCNIVFDESSFSPSFSSYVYQDAINASEYVDYDEDKELYDITDHKDGKSIEVSVLCNGYVLSVDYLKFKNGKITIGAEASAKILLETLEGKHNFIEISQGDVQLVPVEGLDLIKLSDLTLVHEPVALHEDGAKYYYKQGTIQVFVNITDRPPGIKQIPLFSRDRAFLMDLLKFGVPMLLVALFISLFVPDIQEEEEKKIAIIYKKAEVPQKKEIAESENIAKEETDPGNKPDVQPDKKPESAAKQVVNVEKTKPQKVEKKIVKQEASQSKPTKPQQVAEVKPYKFEMKNNINKLFANKADNTSKLQAQASSDNFNKVSDSGSRVPVSVQGDIASNVGKLGRDLKGRGERSFGAQGLASKQGIDTAYKEPKTVVLGSMDPELLRKILREYLPQFRHCYQQELLSNENIKGVVDLNFSINRDGRATKVSIKAPNSQFSAGGVSCMANVLNIIDFPKPKGGGRVDVRQPLNFVSEKSKI